jgi:hypothetical protein
MLSCVCVYFSLQIPDQLLPPPAGAPISADQCNLAFSFTDFPFGFAITRKLYAALLTISLMTFTTKQIKLPISSVHVSMTTISALAFCVLCQL